MTKGRLENLLSLTGDVIVLGPRHTATIDDFLNVAGFGVLPDEVTIQDIIDFDGGRKGYMEFLQQFTS